MLLNDKPEHPHCHIVLAHGAGAPMDTPFMEVFAGALCAQGIGVTRFEFPYMAQRRTGGSKRPPPRVEVLLDEYRKVIEMMNVSAPLFIAGKSLGGRVASMIADDAAVQQVISGVVCLGYPFHPPGKPDRLRTAHLMTMQTPCLIVQGERDPFGNLQDVASYGLPQSVSVHWAQDGNHDLKPRKATGLTAKDNWRKAVTRIVDWMKDTI